MVLTGLGLTDEKIYHYVTSRLCWLAATQRLFKDKIEQRENNKMNSAHAVLMDRKWH